MILGFPIITSVSGDSNNIPSQSPIVQTESSVLIDNSFSKCPSAFPSSEPTTTLPIVAQSIGSPVTTLISNDNSLTTPQSTQSLESSVAPLQKEWEDFIDNDVLWDPTLFDFDDDLGKFIIPFII